MLENCTKSATKASGIIFFLTSFSEFWRANVASIEKRGWLTKLCLNGKLQILETLCVYN